MGSTCFHQLIRIPIGSDPTPYMRKLFLYYHENKRLLQTKNKTCKKVHMFSNIFRFIDDQCTFDNDKSGNSCNNIYPDELELKKDNEDPYIISLRKFNTKLLDKRDAFPFYINRIPHVDSNIPPKIFLCFKSSQKFYVLSEQQQF